MKLAAQFPRIVEAAAANREPHRIAFYLAISPPRSTRSWNRGNDDPARRFLWLTTPKPRLRGWPWPMRSGRSSATGCAIMGVAAAEEMD